MGRRWRDERGAVLVHTAIAVIGLLAFSSLSVDYGVLWVARRQAQNAADAAALAAALSLAYGDLTDMPRLTTRVKNVGVSVAQDHDVWGQPPSITANDVTIINCPAKTPGIPDQCVRVDVFRTAGRSPLPTFFGNLVGVTSQGVRATATAQVAAGQSATCVKPWLMPDKWIERRPTVKAWDLNDKFDRFDKKIENLLGPLADIDEYVAPSANNPGSGFTVPQDIGMPVVLKVENWKNDDISPGNFRLLDLPGVACGGGKSLYRCNIEVCNPNPLKIGDWVDSEPGGAVGPTDQGISALVGSDTAVWTCMDGSVAGPSQQCAGYPSVPSTPRLVPVPAFNVQAFLECVAAGPCKGNGKHKVQITRILGFFIESWTGQEVRGRFTHYPDTGGIANGSVVNSANFLRKVILVR